MIYQPPCLQLPTSPRPLVIQCFLAACYFRRMCNAILCKLSSATTTQGEETSALLLADQPMTPNKPVRSQAGRKLTGKQPVHNSSRHTQVEGSHVVVRHFFDWSDKMVVTVPREETIAISKKLCPISCNSATLRESGT